MTTANLSDHARDRLNEELEVLRAQRRAVTDGLEDVDTAGDRMDDAENLRRHDEAAMLDDRIAELIRLLAGGVQAGGPDIVESELAPGTRVTLRHGNGTVETLRAVAITEEITPGEEDTVLTLDSPLGRAVAGHDVGETVRYETPEGAHRVEIVEVQPPS
jgi:transcription elongation GreA/GreB family factor